MLPLCPAILDRYFMHREEADHRLIVEGFTVEKMAKQLETLYLKLLREAWKQLWTWALNVSV
jgi:hypothetical protein